MDDGQKRLAMAVTAAVVVILAYLVVIKPLITNAAPSKSAVASACAAGGYELDRAIEQWRTDGELQAAAKLAGVAGFGACENELSP
jgi:hypothetical protein